MRYGLEQEFFVYDDQQNLVGPLLHDFTPDECGFLAEARGRPQNSICEAVFSLKADVFRLQQMATKHKMVLDSSPCTIVPHSILLACRRKFVKGTLDYQNLYGYQEHRKTNKKTAGIHISFTEEQAIFDGNHKLITTINRMFDWVQIFRKLDKAFAVEIKAASRYPGFYEIKSDGRIEYRSLPTNCDLMKIIEVLS